MPQEFINVAFFTAKAGQQRQVDVFGDAGFTPTLKRQAPNETKPPRLPEAMPLHVFGHPEQIDHL